MTDHHPVDHRTLKRLQRPWWLSAGVLIIALLLAGVADFSRTSSLPAVLPIALVAAVAAGALATMVAIRNSLPRQQLATDERALATFRGHQALLLVIALAPPLLAAAITSVFGHVATVITGALSGLALVAYGLPTVTNVRSLNFKLAEHGHDVTILHAHGDE